MDDGSKTCMDEAVPILNMDLNQIHNNNEDTIESFDETNRIEDKSYHSSQSECGSTSSCELSDSNDNHYSNSTSSQMHKNKRLKLDERHTDVPSMAPCHIFLDRNEVARYFSKQCRIEASRHVFPSSSKPSKPILAKADKTLKIDRKTYSCYFCYSCKRKFKNALDLRRHKACVHKTEIICQDCYLFFDTQTAFLEHKEICKKSEPEPVIHSESISCNMCCKSYNSQSNLNAHVSLYHSHQPYCKKCIQPFPSYTHLASHICSSKVDSLGVENTLERPKETSNNQLISETIPEVHVLDSEPEIEEVEMVNTSNKNEEIMISNVFSCTIDTSYACDICGVCIKNKRDLRRHKAGTHGVEPYCISCTRPFSSESALKYHDCPRKPKNAVSLYNESLQSDSEPSQLHEQPVIDEDVMLVNVNQTGVSQIQFQPQIEAPVLPDSILKGMVYNSQFQKNSSNGNRNKICCPHCNMCFAIPESLQKHKCPYVKHCKKCNSKSILKDLLVTNASYLCKQCEFKEKEPPQTSNSSSSSDNFRLRCNLCNKELNSKLHVKSHMETEHSTMPYCEKCDTLFNNSDDFILHGKLFHGNNSNIISVQANPITPNLKHLSNVKEKKSNTPLLVTGNNEIIITDTSDEESPMPNKFEFVLIDTLEIRANNANKSIVDRTTVEFSHASSTTFDPSCKDGIQCKLCSTFLKNFNSLKSHVKKVHNRKLLCVYCWTEVSLSGNNILQSHYNSCLKYRAVKNYEKSSQHTAVSSTQQINTHSDYVGINKNMPNFNCDSCNINFASSLDLKIHTNISHSGSYLICHHCRIEFANMAIFITHIHGCENSKISSNFPEVNEVSNEVPVINGIMHIEEQSFDSII